MDQLLVPMQLAFVAVFAASGLGCALGVRRTGRVDDADTRRGLRWLLGTCAVWSGLQVLRFLVPDPEAKTAVYTIGLTVGFASVGAWLYYCSAYAGRDYHREPRIRSAAVVSYVVVVAIKLTNPIHGQYFRTETAMEPFQFLLVVDGPLFWTTTAVSYILSAIGFVLVYDMLSETDEGGRVLWLLPGLLALPVIPTAVGFVVDAVPHVHYEPVGVALFAIGVLCLTGEQLNAPAGQARRQFVDTLNDAIVVVDADGQVREFNRRAAELAPNLSVGDRFPTEVAAVFGGRAETDGGVLRLERDGEARYFHVTEAPVTLGPHEIGRTHQLHDVTETVRRRQEVERQNEQLEDFADAVAHELRNTLNLASGYIDLAARRGEAGDATGAVDAAGKAGSAAERMETIIAEINDVARQARSVEDTRTVSFREAVRSGWAQAAVGDDLELRLEGEGTVTVDPGRFERLVAVAAEFADANGASTLRIELGDSEIRVTGDGAPVPAEQGDALFAYGEAVPDAERGMILPTVATVSRAHGWCVSVDCDYRDGVRYAIEGVRTAAPE